MFKSQAYTFGSVSEPSPGVTTVTLTNLNLSIQSLDSSSSAPRPYRITLPQDDTSASELKLFRWFIFSDVMWRTTVTKGYLSGFMNYMLMIKIIKTKVALPNHSSVIRDIPLLLTMTPFLR